MFRLLFIFIQAAALSVPSSADDTKQGKISDVLDKFGVGARVKLIDVDLLEAITFGVQYRFSAEPSYRGDYFTRIDRYTVENDIGPGELLEGRPLSFGLKRGAEILFAQQFSSGPEARDFKNAYKPGKLPLDSAKALELKPGDYARFNGYMNFVAGLGQVFPLAADVLAARIGFDVLVGGEFQVHVFRLDGSRIRLKIVGENKTGRGFSGKFGVSRELEIFGISKLDKKIISSSELDEYAVLQAGTTRQKLFVVDYTLDLSEDEVRAAYDDVFSSLTRLEDFSVRSAWRERLDVKKLAIASIETLESVYRSRGGSNGKISRHILATNDVLTRLKSYKFGMRAYRVSGNKTYRENFITRQTLNPSGETGYEHYLFPVFTRHRERSALFGRYEERSRHSADALFLADEAGNPRRFLHLGFYSLHEDTLLDRDEYARLRQHVELLLPPDAEYEFALHLQNTGWLDFNDRRRARLELGYFFRENALLRLMELGYGRVDQMKRAVREFAISALEAGEFPFFHGNLDEFVARYKPQLREVPHRILRDRIATANKLVDIFWGSDLDRMASRLAFALNAEKDNHERLESLTQLRRSSTYHKIGPAFFIYLIHQNEIDIRESLYLEVAIQARNHQSVKYVYGGNGERELYEVVRYIENVLNDRGQAMREPEGADRLLERVQIVTPVYDSGETPK